MNRPAPQAPRAAPPHDPEGSPIADNIRRVRILIADLADPPAQIFTDDELTEYLLLHVDDVEAAELRDVRLAAADCLEAMSTSEVMTSKVIRTAAGISTDGAKVAAELRARAAGLRDLVEREDYQAAADATDGMTVSGYGWY